MEMREYQVKSQVTAQVPESKGMDPIVPLFGLAGEVGEILNEYKKYLRDGSSHLRFKERLSEELGDLLWYIADTASQFGINLNAVAAQNITKTRARWNRKPDGELSAEMKPHLFDTSFPKKERFPRKFVVHIMQRETNVAVKMRAFVGKKKLGQDLTDNAHLPDGYRFHDVFHLACAGVLGWSPVVRRNLDLKRRTAKKVDEVEDGGRAIVTEEGISALVFAYAVDHNDMKNITSVDYHILKAIKSMTANLEVAVCTTGEWEAAILQGYNVWRQVAANKGGFVEVNLNHRSVRYLGATIARKSRRSLR